MIRIHDTTRTIPYYQPEPLTDLPLIYQREHLFPYTSYGATATRSEPCAFRMVVLENDTLRVEVAPKLGGRVYSLFDKRIGQEILFSNPVVKPVRILPIWGFISGGIEFNFPIAHSPTSIAEVGCQTGQTGDYGFIRVGEFNRPIGIFGAYTSLTFVTTSALAGKRILAQDLAGQTPVDITSEVKVSDSRLTIPGAVIHHVGLMAAKAGDISDPGLVLAVEGLTQFVPKPPMKPNRK